MLAAVAAAALGLRALVMPFHVTNPRASSAIATTICLVALVSGFLLWARFAATRSRRDLSLLAALACLAAGDFAFSALPPLTGIASTLPTPDTRTVLNLLVATAFLVAARVPDTPVKLTTHAALLRAGLPALALVGYVELTNQVSRAATSRNVLLSPNRLALDAIGVLAILAASVLLGAAGVMFVRREARENVSAGLLAGAMFFLIASAAEPLVMAISDPDWITPNDGLRLVAYALLAVAALRRFGRARRTAAAQALQAQREYIAQDLHDGLAQDLAVIALHSQRLEAELGFEHPLRIAARNALAVTRGELIDLSASDAGTLEDALEQVAGELTSRLGVPIRVEVEPGAMIVCEPIRREHLVRIAREAIVNAVTHGGAQHIEIALTSYGTGVRLRIVDDGSGICADAVRRRAAAGQGLRMMRARVHAMGGRVRVQRRAHGGTELEVLVP